MFNFGDDSSVDETNVTLEDLTIDEDLKDIDRIIEFSACNIALQRLVHVRMLANVANLVDFEEAASKLFPLVVTFSKDEEYLVRQDLCDQILQLVQLCSNYDEDNDAVVGYQHILQLLLPTLANLLLDSHTHVRNHAMETFIQVVSYVKKEDRMEHVLSVVLSCANEDKQEELRMVGCILLNKLCPLFSQDECDKFIAPVSISLTEDQIFRVRKIAAVNLNQIFLNCSDHIRNSRLVSAFLKLSKDPIWGVRKACAAALYDISNTLNDSERVTVIVPTINSFLQDNSKWVRIAIYQHLGSILSTMNSKQIPQDLLQQYLNMDLENSIQEESKDINVHYFCAFSLPGVVATIGKERWSEIYPTFHRLVRDKSVPVRRTLSHSLYEIAKIIGQENSETYLKDAFEFFMNDLEEVKVGALGNMANFLMCLPPKCREMDIGRFNEAIQQYSKEWRNRLLIALQIPTIARIFSISSTYSTIVPLVFSLAQDHVADIRNTAFNGFGALIKRLKDHDYSWFMEVLRQISDFSKSEDFVIRESFIHIVYSLLGTESLTLSEFKQYLMPYLLKLSKDKVVNVRILFAQQSFKHTIVCEIPEVQKALNLLCKDVECDVAFAAKADMKEWDATIGEKIRQEKMKQRKEERERLLEVQKEQFSVLPKTRRLLERAASSDIVPDAS